MYLLNYVPDQPCPVSPSSHQHLCWSRGIKCWATSGVPSCTKRTNQDILSAFPVPCICTLLLPSQPHSQELLDYFPRWQVSLGALSSLAAAGAPDVLHVWHHHLTLHAGHTEDHHPPWARAVPCRGQTKNRATKVRDFWSYLKIATKVRDFCSKLRLRLQGFLARFLPPCPGKSHPVSTYLWMQKLKCFKSKYWINILFCPWNYIDTWICRNIGLNRC